MKTELILAVVCAMVSLALAGNEPGDWRFELWTSGKRSPRVDDGVGVAKCPRGYSIKSCHWMIYQSDYDANKLPDGVKIADRSDDIYCEAYNQAFGRGVVGSAHCIKAVLTVKSDDKKGDNELRRPIATCPPGYSLLPAGCNLHADKHHQYPLAAALSDGDSCFTSTDCLHCKVTARCMLRADSFTRERLFPPPIEGQLSYLGGGTTE